MFNIFRRSKNKRKPEKLQANSQHLNIDKLASLNAEQYRPLSEDDRGNERRPLLPTEWKELEIDRGGNAFGGKEPAGNRNTVKESRREQSFCAANDDGASTHFVRNPKQQSHSRLLTIRENFYFDEGEISAETAPNFTAAISVTSASGSVSTDSAAAGDDGLTKLTKFAELSKNTGENIVNDWSEQQTSSGGSRNELIEQQRRVYTDRYRNNIFSRHENNDKPFFHQGKKHQYQQHEPTAAAIGAASANETVQHRSCKESARKADNISKRKSWLAVTLGNVRHRSKEEAVEEDKNKAARSERKTEEAPLRKATLLSHSKTTDNGKQFSTIHERETATEKATRSKSKFLDNDSNATTYTREHSGERTKLEKSRDFLSEILMARGRNHKRHNQQKKQQQKQQQQKQAEQHRQSHRLQSTSNDHTSSSSASSPASPADVTSNQRLLTVCNDYVDPKLQNPSHLETSLDPAGNTSTNNLQMTESKNNNKNSNSLSASVSENRLKSDDVAAESDAEAPKAVAAASNERRETRAASPERADELRTSSTAFTPHSTTNASQSTIDNCECAEAVAAPNEFAALNPHPQHKFTSAELITDKPPNIKPNACSTDSAPASEPQQPLAAVKTAPTIDDAESLENSGNSRTLKETKNQLNELTECDRDRWLQRGTTDDNQALPLGEMGQSNVKPETRESPKRREFRESSLVNTSDEVASSDSPPKPKAIVVPTIIVDDYSDGDSGDGSPLGKDVFYDFDSGPGKNSDAQNDKNNVINEAEKRSRVKEEDVHGLSISVVDDAVDDDSVFYAADGVLDWQFIHSDQLRHRNHSPLAEVLEEEEGEDEEEVAKNVAAKVSSSLCKTSGDLEDGRRHLRSTNSNDSNLSSSFQDSGIGSDAFSTHADSPAKLQTPDNCCDLLHERVADAAKGNSNVRQSPSRSTATTTPTPSRRLPFVRDGSSMDCDETLTQSDDFDFVVDACEQVMMPSLPDERLVCIESISLPDVVESTGSGNINSSSSQSQSCNSLASAASNSSDGEHIVNINGATGNSMSNVHFVPIHVESGGVAAERQKRRSFDDSVIGGKKTFAHFNGHRGVRSTVEITAEEDDDAIESLNVRKGFVPEDASIAEKLKRDLVNQESRLNAQLEDAKNNTYNLQRKVNELQTHIDVLEKDLALKTWNVDRLQGELLAAHKDDEYVRRRLKLLEDEKTSLRHKYSDNEEEFKRKYGELEQKYKDLEEKYKETCHLASDLHTQLAAAQAEAEECRERMEKLRIEMQEQLRILRNALENSEAERKICEDKWQKEFEMLRTHNQDREESLMTDCEWQLRQMQRVCKEKVDKAEYGHQEARERAEILENAAQERLQVLQRLRTCEAEAKSLRGLASEQEISLQALGEQIESLKTDLKAANENLEDQIEAVRKIKYQCDNKIYDKERELIQRIDEVRNEAASFWENKLYTEMTRLKSELESVFVDERRDALDKLQAEHIEELRALTTRYTANEEELRAELAELQDRLDLKNSEFLELREKSDSALLQTRMHLDRADREYQNAMFREEARREALEESLRKEFESEKLEMEEDFRERLGQVKDEFARELQMSTQEMTEHHAKDLEQQKLKLLAEKDEALQELTERHRKKLANAEDHLKDIELRHQRDLKDLKATYDAEKLALDKRDISNANEIEQLHRKCRCLTNLFEEMRMRYERRDPRQEDLREIAELRSRCESQERDLYLLTDRLREMQIQMEELQQNGDCNTRKSIKKPSKTIPTNCGVIYEENEERESPETAAVISQLNNGDGNHEREEKPMKQAKFNGQKFNNNNQSSNHHNINNNSRNRSNNNVKCGDRIDRDDNDEDDDGHMITAM